LRHRGCQHHQDVHRDGPRHRRRTIRASIPVTLYKEQWTKVLAMADEIRAFLKEHDAELKTKPDS
jgi:hypothetical protein